MIGHNGGPQDEARRSGLKKAKAYRCAAREPDAICDPAPYAAASGPAVYCTVCGRSRLKAKARLPQPVRTPE